MKKKCMLFFTTVIFFTLMNIQATFAQTWDIAGNNNATSTSKLGTTNLIPLRLFTNNLERLRIDPAGNIGIGTATPLNLLTVKLSGSTPVASWTNGGSLPAFLAFGENMSTGSNLATASDIPSHRPVVNFRRSRGTLAAPTKIANNDYLASFVASGYDGGNFQNPASIDFYVDGNPTSGNVPGRISFVTGTNVGNRKERLQVGSSGNFNFNNGQFFIQQSNGNVGIGTIQPSSKLEVNGTGSFGKLNVSGNTNINTSGGFGKLNVESDGPSSPGDGGIGIYVLAYGPAGIGVLGKGGTGVEGRTLEGTGVYGHATGDGSEGDGPGIGVYGRSDFGIGIIGDGDDGVRAISKTINGNGVRSIVSGASNYGVNSYSENSYGLYAQTGNNSSYAGVFSGSVYSSGFYQSSDIKLKRNILNVENAMSIINQLQPKNYEYREDGNFANMNLPAGKHYGFIAQDVEKILPNLVKQTQFNIAKAISPEVNPSGVSKLNAKGVGVRANPKLVNSAKKEEPGIIDFKAVNYSEIIPIVVKAMQEQHKQIIDLQNQISDLKALLSKENYSFSPGKYLKQNIPNPAGASTYVGYELPENAISGQLKIADMKGSIVKVYNIPKGSGQLNIKSGELPAGVYNYTLFAGGKRLDTKQMVISK